MKILTVSEKEGNILEEGKKNKVRINSKKFYFIEKKMYLQKKSHVLSLKFADYVKALKDFFFLMRRFTSLQEGVL